ncbi:hypothetical protein KFE25_000227 [Diacronema lutheri]|uniref:Peptidase M14 domain-containing protein n=1 Tax=Diacronema lutheri TaxID=2081491 RepID=A0A8J5XNZ6_DIALT|nr:hypothetical protein KFE25_000227 [Diacronema lutheri]
MFAPLRQAGGHDCVAKKVSSRDARIDALQRLPSAASRLRVSSLCSSVGGHDVPLLTITDFAGASEAELRERKVVVVTARVHPGETNASWMMHGVIDELLADSAEARELRSALVFQVVPCLNPDGVILGNYRCSLSGDDLNRNCAEPSARKHPTIAHVKALLRGLAEEERLLFFCDFHGHSRKKSTFMCGVETPAGKGAPPGSHAGRLHERVFPLLLSRFSASFSFASCSFKVLRSKETTGRVVVARSFGLVPSYTLFSGPDGPGADGTPEAHYTIPDLQKLGKEFVHALRDFTHPSRTEYMGALAELEAMLPPKENAGGEVSDEDGEPTERDEAGARRSAPARRKSTPLA